MSGLGVLYGGDGADTLTSGALTDGTDDNLVYYGGEGADEFFLNDASQTAAATSATVTIADFEVGVDKISVDTDFFSAVSPTLATIANDVVVAARNNIGMIKSGTSDVIVHLSGAAANEYLEIKILGVTSVAITDFEIL